ncbi:unnamed protein product [Acanthocheilonema viteae]|uniref:Uncharacterized protein n=1 Tax=Acanthocheilonema viteae TaxID=6277 RepID=A0A498S2J2_ACAVI|nr:unnamed protein product [Acanthocheilonema viteae]
MDECSGKIQTTQTSGSVPVPQVENPLITLITSFLMLPIPPPDRNDRWAKKKLWQAQKELKKVVDLELIDGQAGAQVIARLFE